MSSTVFPGFHPVNVAFLATLFAAIENTPQGVVLSMTGALGLLASQLYLIGDLPHIPRTFFFSLPKEDGSCSIPIWYLYVYFTYAIGVCVLVNVFGPARIVGKGSKNN